MAREFDITSGASKARPHALLVRTDSHLSLKGIVEAHTVCHVLVLRVAVLTVELVWLALLQEHHLIRVVRPLHDAREVHCVVDLVLRLEHFFETEVVMTFLQRVEGDVLVVTVIDIFAHSTRRRIGKH